MSDSPGPGGRLLQAAWQAALVVLTTAVVARVAWEFLKPMVPAVVVFVAIVGIYGYMLRGRRR